MPPGNKGIFVTLEGVEGTGKSTLTARLLAELIVLGIPAVATREPGGSSIGGTVRSILLRSDSDIPPLTDRAEALLFAADRAQHVAEFIQPSLDAGNIVLCDRFIDSSVAYQGVGRSLGAKTVRDISLWATNGCLPDLTFLVDLDPAVGISRKAVEEVNRMENEPLEFHNKIRKAFLKFAEEKDTETVWYVVDGTQSLETVYEAFRNTVILTWLLKNIHETKYLSTIEKALDALAIAYDPEESLYTLEANLQTLLDAYER